MREIKWFWQAFTIVLAPGFEEGIDKLWHLDVPVLCLDFYAITVIAMVNMLPTTVSMKMSAARNSFLPAGLRQAIHKIIEDFIFATFMTYVKAFLPRWDDP
jgi:hypothetical protein